MVVKIQKPGLSSSGALEYNMQKVEAGGAAIITCANSGDVPAEWIGEVFRSMEDSPAVSQNTRRFSFHASIDPSPDDRFDDSAAEELCRDIMDRLGYGSQPWVLFRHDDIGRPHYHVVSTRIRPDGSTVPGGNEGRRLHALLTEISTRYGFTVGRADGTPRAAAAPGMTFMTGSGPIRERLLLLAGRALEYLPCGRLQTEAVLRSLGVRARGTVTGINLQGLDERGTPCTRPVRAGGMDSQLASDLQEAVSRDWDSEGTRKARSRAAGIVGSCLMHSSSWDELLSMLSRRGIDCMAVTGSDGLTREAVFTDHTLRRVTDTSMMPRSGILETIRAREASGSWRTEKESQHRCVVHPNEESSTNKKHRKI